MADKDEVVVIEDDGDADFDAGFSTPVVVKTPPADDLVNKDDALPPLENKDDPPPAPVVDKVDASVVPEPKFVQITEEQLARFEAAADKNGGFEKRFSTISGTLGSIQEIVKKIQSGTPKGDIVEIPADAFTDMEEDYPQLAKHFRTTLEKTLKGVRGTGSVTASVNPEELNELVSSRVAEGVKAAQVETLEDVFPDWREIVGAVNIQKGEQPDPNNAFRKWLSTQPADYEAKVKGSHSAVVLSNAIAKFKEATKVVPKTPTPPPPKELARKKRVEAAIQPKGDGNPPPPPKTGDDEFDEGFARARRSG